MIKEVVNKAYNFAQKAHRNQNRRFTDLNYFTHPKCVARTVEEMGGDEDMVAAALLHDVIEDTTMTFRDLANAGFNERILDLVAELTNDEKAISKVGKSEYITSKMSGMTDDALTIKLADRLQNISFLEDPRVSDKFRDKYTEETQYVLLNLYSRRPMNDVQVILFTRIRGINSYLLKKRQFEKEKDDIRAIKN